MKLFLKGERCFSPKCPLEKKGAVAPGEQGMKYKRRLSDYGIQLREKQKIKRLYGITERKLKAYYRKAAKEKASTGEALLRQLETRLDNVVFKGGLTPSRSIARQVVNHGQILVNGKKVDIASYQVKPGEIVTLTTKGLKMELIKKALASKPNIPPWLKKKTAVVKIERLPQREEMESIIRERLIVEFYSR